MGFSDLFKKTNYFDPKMNPQCGYCQFGKRTKEGGGGRVICEKKGIVNETDSCKQFVYSPLKRIPVKQLEKEGVLLDDDMYVEVDDSKPTAAEQARKAEEEAKAAAEAQAAEQARLAAEAEAQAAEQARLAAEAEAAAQAEAQTQAAQQAAIDAALAEYVTPAAPAAAPDSLSDLAALAEAAAAAESANNQ